MRTIRRQGLAFILGAVLATATVVQAASYTITVTTGVRQETALTAIVARVNAERAARTPPLGAITNQQYLTAIVDQALASYRQQYEDDSAAQVKAALPTATDAQLAQIKTILGIQ